MTNQTRHPDWDTLNEFVDGVLPDALTAEVREHLGHCAQCSAMHEDVLQLVHRLQHAPVPQAPAELWQGVHASVSTYVRATPVKTLTQKPQRVFSLSAQQLAAAAVLLVIATTAATVLFTRERGGSVPVVAIDTLRTPLELTATDRQYLATVEQLETELIRTRQQLQPSTIAMVERSLATIDTALAEAREALLADPANAELREVLESAYRQKVDFLKRAMQIASQE